MKLTTKLSTGGRLFCRRLEFIIREREEGILLRPKAPVSERSWESIVGCIGYRGQRKSLKENVRGGGRRSSVVQVIAIEVQAWNLFGSGDGNGSEVWCSTGEFLNRAGCASR